MKSFFFQVINSFWKISRIGKKIEDMYIGCITMKIERGCSLMNILIDCGKKFYQIEKLRIKEKRRREARDRVVI